MLQPEMTTVVMVTRDRREQTLHSLQQQTDFHDGTPIIVVDNGSSDGTAAAIAGRFAHVRVIEAGRNLGAIGRNVGVEAATTPYVAFADDDSWWAPGALTDAARLFDDSPRLGLLGCRIVLQPSGGTDPSRGLMVNSPLPRCDDLPGPSLLGFVACGSVVRRAAFLDAGGFHSLIPFGGEESIVAIDLAARGWGLAYADDITAFHRPLPSADRAGRRRLIIRNGLLTAWLRRPLPTAVWRTARWGLELRDSEVRAALAEFLVRLPQALRHRKPVPSWLEEQLRLLEAD